MFILNRMHIFSVNSVDFYFFLGMIQFTHSFLERVLKGDFFIFWDNNT